MSHSNDSYAFLSFATGNFSKYNEASLLLPGLKLLKIDLPEPQELDTKKITQSKLQHVISLGLREVIVEDVALHLEGINGLPGPLVKWFLKALKADGIYEIAKRSGNLRAKAVAVLGYVDSSGETALYEGEVAGTLVPPRGGDGFGWDPIFVPDGGTLSYAELSDLEKSNVSHRARALKRLIERFEAK